ncbi:hypothetical protein IFM46972_04607 [Aspergillus udagawae]|uniref:Uncharacterized protein n=1 Tax=Aspergillus udagawae TaxID=91492 RepID=A0A8H3NT46_9EURO|nr:hypothetical protein IFM46972_04607 [Aspergillus udagawae]
MHNFLRRELAKTLGARDVVSAPSSPLIEQPEWREEGLLYGTDCSGLLWGKSVLISLHNATESEGLNQASGENLTSIRGGLESSLLRISHGLPVSRGAVISFLFTL